MNEKQRIPCISIVLALHFGLSPYFPLCAPASVHHSGTNFFHLLGFPQYQRKRVILLIVSEMNK